MSKLFLDLDGVLADLIRGIARWLNRPYPYDDPANLNNYHTSKAFGVAFEDIWPILPRNVWANLDWMPDGKEILRRVEKRFGKENICILTAPPHYSIDADVEAYHGKMVWMYNMLPYYFHRKQYLVGSAKHYGAGGDVVLLDDAEHNVNNFRQHGGRAVLVPRPWNPLHGVETMLHLEKELL